MPSLGRLLGYCLALTYAANEAVAAPKKLLRSRHTPGAQVTYQKPNICETTPGVKSYSGYVTLPATSLHPYTQNLFFWFFEARKDPETAPLTVWLQGGPGAPSIDQALSENGPCLVNEDSNSTTLNPYSWNTYSNMLYIDSPVQAGFSYDEAVQGVVDMTSGDITVGGYNGSLDVVHREGTFSSQDESHTVNNTAVAAEAIYEFDQYRRDKINVWSQSYGGHYAPAVAHLFHTRSASAKKRSCGGNTTTPLNIGVESVGIINGLLDFLVMGEHLANFPNNNTYGIKSYDDAIWDSIQTNWTKPEGCKEQAEACKALTPNGYHDQYGTNETVIGVCGGAYLACGQNMYFAFDEQSEREYFDITQMRPTPEAPPYAFGFLAQGWVRDALGARVNYTQTHNPTVNAFFGTGDYLIGGFTDDLGELLDDGIKVALIYGDRDYRCNWVGGEAASLSIEYSGQDAFATAGYTEMSTNETYVGGLVRQVDNFSFTRVFQSGHSVGFYQPETAVEIFARTLRGLDIATGQTPLNSQTYTTSGPTSVFDVTNEFPAQREQFCYVGAQLSVTCSDAQIAALEDGTAVVDERGIVVSPEL
ncbi:Alpha/Beta hydrolase protein [Xylariaceae sp. FL0016]|nr:Alpha/Beta hydrolase protein [Xylariaceae sp. FL0016]